MKTAMLALVAAAALLTACQKQGGETGAAPAPEAATPAPEAAAPAPDASTAPSANDAETSPSA